MSLSATALTGGSSVQVSWRLRRRRGRVLFSPLAETSLERINNHKMPSRCPANTLGVSFVRSTQRLQVFSSMVLFVGPLVALGLLPASSFVILQWTLSSRWSPPTALRKSFIERPSWDLAESRETQRSNGGRITHCSTQQPQSLLFMATIAVEKGLSSSLNDDRDDSDNDDEEDEEDDDDDDEYSDDSKDSTIPADHATLRFKHISHDSPQQPQAAASLDRQLQRMQLEPDLNAIGRQQGVAKTKKAKRANKAMRDPQFLRKRTSDLLKATLDMKKDMYYDNEECIVLEDSTTSSDCDIATQANTNNIIGKAMKVERKTFHFLIDAWAFSGEDDAADQAIKLLECMEQFGLATIDNKINNKPHPLQPDVRSYTKTINAIARRGDINAGVQAEVIFQRMQMRRKNSPKDDASCQPNAYSYTALIQAHANCGAASRAHEILQSVVQRFQLDYQKRQAQPPQSTPQTTVIVQPSAKAFHAVIQSFGKAGQADQAEQVLLQLEHFYDRYGHVATDAKPNHYHYNTLISAWANSNNHHNNNNNNNEGGTPYAVGERAEHVLKRMTKYVEPTTVSYNAVLDAYAKSGQAEKAEALLRSMLQSDNDNNPDNSGNNKCNSAVAPPPPNTRSFNSVMNAWAKSKHPENALRAELLLDLMKKLFYEDSDGNVKPDVHSFCTVINAWARSPKKDKAERAYNLFKEMEKLYVEGNECVRPNVVALNAVMNACAYTTADDIRISTRAVEIAHKVLKQFEMKRQTVTPYGIPDHITYGTFLQVIATQMPDTHTRDQVAKVLFKKCIQSGQLSSFVLQQLQAAVSPTMYHELIGKQHQSSSYLDTSDIAASALVPTDMFVRVQDLPRSWWCNCNSNAPIK